MEEQVYANREYKDSVFRMLYREKNLKAVLPGLTQQEKIRLLESGGTERYHAGQRHLSGHEERRIFPAG